MGQLPQEVYRKLHPCMYGCFRFMCVAEYLHCHAGGTNLWLIFFLQVNEMVLARRSCRNKPDMFCYICEEYTIAPNRKPVTSFIMCAYHAYFGIKLADQDKAWPPHMVCKACTETVWVDQWQEESELWNSHGLEGADKPCHWLLLLHCWCDWDQQKEPGKPQVSWSSINTSSCCDEIPVHIFGELPDICDEDASSVEGHEDEEEVILEDDAAHPFSQKELNDLVCDLSLSKDSTKLLASRSKEKNLSDSAHISFFCNRHQEYLCFSLQWRT